MGEEPGEGSGCGHCSPTGGACIWPARLGSKGTLILLSARPGAGLGNVTFQRKLFPFSPQERKRQKDKQTPRVVYWETGQHMDASPPSLAPLQMPRNGCVHLTEFIQAKDKWISQFIQRGRGVSLLTSLDSPLSSALPAHYVTLPWRTSPAYLQAWGQPPGIHTPEREVTLDLQGGAGSSPLGLALRPWLLSGAPHTIGKSEKLKTEIIELPTPDVSLLRLRLARLGLILSCLFGDNSKHFISLPLQIVLLLNYKSNAAIFPIN